MSKQTNHKFNLYLSAFGLLAFSLIALGLSYYAIEQRTQQRHICAFCRLERIDYGSTLHDPESETIENNCSRWYLREVEKTHEHIWVANSTIQLLDLQGNVIGAGESASRPGRMIWRLSPEEQIQIYQNSENDEQVKSDSSNVGFTCQCYG